MPPYTPSTNPTAKAFFSGVACVQHTRHVPRARLLVDTHVANGVCISSSNPVPLTPPRAASGAAAGTPISVHRTWVTRLDVQTRAGGIRSSSWTAGLNWSIRFGAGLLKAPTAHPGGSDGGSRLILAGIRTPAWLTQQQGSWHAHPRLCPTTTPAVLTLNCKISWRASLELTLMRRHRRGLCHGTGRLSGPKNRFPARGACRLPGRS